MIRFDLFKYLPDKLIALVVGGVEDCSKSLSDSCRSSADGIGGNGLVAYSSLITGWSS